MNRNNLDQIVDEFGRSLDDIYGLFINVGLAYLHINDRLGQIIPNSSDDNTIHFGNGDPNDPSAKIHLSVNIREFKNNIKPGGRDSILITNLCIVSIYQLWEDHYREKIAKAKGLKKSELKSDIFGDLNRIRQAIIHHNNKKISEFSKIKILNYMKEREQVFFKREEFDELIVKIKGELKKLKIQS